MIPPPPRDATVRAIRREWRRLTGGRGVRDADRPTLLACSGGADSSAMVLALAGRARAAHLVVAHIVHDLRPPPEAHADRDAARALAEGLGLAFVEGRVGVRALPGNAEAVARRARYAALADLARAHGCRAIATAHHADDQLESLLLALCRGAAATSLVGIAPSRPLGEGLALIRPCLALSREELMAMCLRCGYGPAHDATNDDPARARAYLRQRVLPLITERFPHAPARAAETARSARAARQVLEAGARNLLHDARVEAPEPALRLALGPVRQAPGAIATMALRLAIAEACGQRGMDRVPARTVRAIHGAARARPDTTRRFDLAHATITIDARTITIQPRIAPPTDTP